jgi:hypothetical protein
MIFAYAFSFLLLPIAFLGYLLSDFDGTFDDRAKLEVWDVLIWVKVWQESLECPFHEGWVLIRHGVVVPEFLESSGQELAVSLLAANAPFEDFVHGFRESLEYCYGARRVHTKAYENVSAFGRHVVE